MARFLLFFIVLVFGGCGATNYYSFSDLEMDDGIKSNYSSDVGVAKITLPSYMKQNRVVIQTAPNKLSFLQGDEWVDSLDLIATQTMINHLQKFSQGAKISLYPWDFEGNKGQKVTIHISRFIAYEDSVTLEATYSIQGITKGSSRVDRSFKTIVPTDIKNTDKVVESMNMAFRYLAKDIHKALI
ncbi:MAG: hypothetical protein KN64_08090 [Sulfurovum sp. AS07-7]|nr:MAG: hypothetical protein KN64_08090 [Sulfurovum sp. AS07-7]